MTPGRATLRVEHNSRRGKVQEEMSRGEEVPRKKAASPDRQQPRHRAHAAYSFAATGNRPEVLFFTLSQSTAERSPISFSRREGE